ncbi:MAG: NUDIX domain-containing protein [Deltaproteobacteria bacterium]|jgi:8-oxo-dGTP diphosphatase|nr:NUDIX domain-containing protein [Deltaproteobacteria bacterium]
MPGPAPTVDVLIEMQTDGRPGLVFIERKHEPLGWAIPGGFIDEGETAAAAAVREAKEETELDVELIELFHVYSDPGRDPRLHTMSVVFIGKASGTPRGADDAARAAVYPVDDLPELVFDHGTILADYLRYRETGQRPPVER